MRAIALTGGHSPSSWFSAAGSLAGAAGEYPMKLTLNAQLKTAATTVTSSVTIAVKRLMEESRRQRVTDGLK